MISPDTIEGIEKFRVLLADLKADLQALENFTLEAIAHRGAKVRGDHTCGREGREPRLF